MKILTKGKTILKKYIVHVFGLLDITFLTKSDRNTTGLQPIVREFFLRHCLGVLHIGAHEGQEAKFYHNLTKPVIWIEALPTSFRNLSKNIYGFKNQTAINAMLASRCLDSRDFFVTSNNGESSSLYPLAGNSYWKELENVDICQLPARRLDCLFSDMEIEKFDYWVIDVQGAEIEVLEGAGTLLKHCRYLQIEISQEIFYLGGTEFKDLRRFLESKSFFPLWLPSKPHEEIIFRNFNLK
jgi:FkbM family methyltransferase